MNPNKRYPDEPFEVYKERRKEQNKELERRLKGRPLWLSVLFGPYIKAKHGELTLWTQMMNSLPK